LQAARVSFAIRVWLGEIPGMEKSPEIGLKKGSRDGAIDVLQGVLSDLLVLGAKTRAAHWGVSGLHFQALHAMFGEQYDAIEAEMDEVAERIRSLGGFPVSTVGGLLGGARLADTDVVKLGPAEMVGALLADHEALIRTLRTGARAADEKFDDAGTNDFLVGLMATHEKTAWMLRASAA
jgi:starvation-inducible DNA-binding protein